MMHARFVTGENFSQPISKVVCVGRNYAEHAKELNNPIPTSPILFIKPSSALAPLNAPLHLPQGEQVHYEAELAILIGSTLCHADVEAAGQAIAGLGLALDLTLREVQSQLKEKGLPWEIAKSFDGACPLSPFSAYNGEDLAAIDYQFLINGELRQHGQTRLMLTPIPELLAFISKHFTLVPGDIVLTGTPAGVGKLNSGDTLALQSSFGVGLSTQVE